MEEFKVALRTLVEEHQDKGLDDTDIIAALEGQIEDLEDDD